MKFKEFTLDPFQEEAIQALLRDESVVVSAATGTGKTLIADYMIDHAIKNNVRVFYTAPIKALSNQKFLDFSTAYGKDKVGLLTGDTVINPEAQIIVMTAEIYRNMLMEGSSSLNSLKYVVFDEIHYINDIERGTVWEEALIFSPDQVRFICLSATIPNYEQFASWISSISNHKVSTVSYMERAVPLEHYVYEYQTGLTTIDTLEQDIAHERKRFHQIGGRRRRHRKQQRFASPVASHMDVVRELKAHDWLPCIFFVFSRKATLEKAKELAKHHDFTKPDEKEYIISYVRKHISAEIADMPSVQAIRQILPKGIGVHNAGLLPAVKEIVEHLFNKGLLRVLYTTETFAVGINMPAKTVCFAALEKYDGVSFRYLNTKEYFQLAGRAGRRGIDKVGRSIVLVNRNDADLQKIRATTLKDVDPIISQFRLSYNMVLNLVRNYPDNETIEVILRSNFGYFVKRQSAQQSRITTSYKNYKRLLVKLGYIVDDKLTEKGVFTCYIYTKELAFGELVFDGIFDQLSEKDINIVVASLIYESRRSDKFNTRSVNVDELVGFLSQNKTVARRVRKNELRRIYKIVSAWSSGSSFEELLDLCNLAEGDLIRLFRQVIDVLRQIRSGLKETGYNPALLEKIERCIELVDRDVVSVTF